MNFIDKPFFRGAAIVPTPVKTKKKSPLNISKIKIGNNQLGVEEEEENNKNDGFLKNILPMKLSTLNRKNA